MSLRQLVDRSDLLGGLAGDTLEYLESVAEGVQFEAGSLIFEEDDTADRFFLIETGRVGLEVPMATGLPVLIETLGDGDLVGISWLFPPYRWAWRARALESTAAFAFETASVRQRCETDDALALNIYRTVATSAVDRLHAARVRLLDLYPGTRT